MKAEPTLNEMCEYIDEEKPKGWGFEINQFKAHKSITALEIRNPAPTLNVYKQFGSMYAAIEFLFNYYFAVNNK